MKKLLLLLPILGMMLACEPKGTTTTSETEDSVVVDSAFVDTINFE